MSDIFLIEDEQNLADFVIRGLTKEGHSVDHAARGDVGLERALRCRYDALIVDRMLPGLDGLSLVKALRAKQCAVPVLFLSNLGELDDRVLGLNAGGDDYLPKPFGFSELLARVNALLRRPAVSVEQIVLRLGELEVHLVKREVKRCGQDIDLKPREFTLLEYLMRHANQVVTRTMLLEGVWGYHFDPKTNIVETHISRLRARIGSDMIQTVRGSGYMIHAPRTDA
ncbi:two-component system OmpR family response regulator [Rhizomicrobium palustre]|uniref:Two-component system OmpR family response regulator n=1 Tax=Rhizomicrobium palustre TaxID=189966 RepID=A0A846MUX3_9PROT|nr:response regulator transcription factor [Rhizomicrobium palustre]NIK87166.1 two-component system OmpR family response regulator [Rhizomicrobium palustre]